MLDLLRHPELLVLLALGAATLAAIGALVLRILIAVITSVVVLGLLGLGMIQFLELLASV